MFGDNVRYNFETATLQTYTTRQEGGELAWQDIGHVANDIATQAHADLVAMTSPPPASGDDSYALASAVDTPFDAPSASSLVFDAYLDAGATTSPYVTYRAAITTVSAPIQDSNSPSDAGGYDPVGTDVAASSPPPAGYDEVGVTEEQSSLTMAH